MTPTIRGSALASYGEVARSLGLDPVMMLRQAGLDPQALTRPDIRLNARRFGDLLERSAAVSGCLTFGLRMAERRRLSDFGTLSLLIAHQSTVRDVLATVARYSDLINDSLNLTVEEAHGTVVVREQLLAERPGVARQAHELTVGVLLRIFQALIGDRWQAVSVNFTHPPPGDLTDHRRMFGEAVVFNSEFNGLVCDTRDLDRANPAGDEVLAAYARRVVDDLAVGGVRGDAHGVRRVIAERLPEGRATLARTAVHMGLSARTLQRRLADGGTDFQTLLDEVRVAQARTYVEDSDLPLMQVAQLLGYSQPAAFSRWFQSRFGASPSVVRRRPVVPRRPVP